MGAGIYSSHACSAPEEERGGRRGHTLPQLLLKVKQVIIQREMRIMSKRGQTDQGPTNITAATDLCLVELIPVIRHELLNQTSRIRRVYSAAEQHYVQ